MNSQNNEINASDFSATQGPIREIKKLISENEVMIFATTTCPFCIKVKKLFEELGIEYKSLDFDTLGEDGPLLRSSLAELVERTSVPQVFVRGQHIGGYDDTKAAHSSGILTSMLGREEPHSFDHDLIVIGGGSGGLAASKMAATMGKSVAVLDFVVPTPLGTTWGLGGTCVNVGCIPKKLMHSSALLGQAIKDAKPYGWNVPEGAFQHNWETLRDNIANYIRSLNWNYRVQLRSEKVKYKNCLAKFITPNKIKAISKSGTEEEMTARHFIVATGERPRYPEIPGAQEYGITSDDLFYLSYCPGKTLVVGASYVALECAGFLRGLGLDVTIMVRSIFLRGFDQQMAEKIGAELEEEGIKILRPCIPTKVVQEQPGAPGVLRVFGKMTDGDVEISDTYNTVLFAIGRDPCTKGIGLEDVGVKLNPRNGRVEVDNEQTSVPNIFAIGDIIDKGLQLTPVAIQAGILLAKRLYGSGTEKCDYTNVPTTVFTPLEYGCIGLAEEDAIAQYGQENVRVYHSQFTPLEYTVAGRSSKHCYCKLICLKNQDEKVIGFHYLGPNAGEVTQGFALGFKLGATKAHFDQIIGIHPTCAEIFTTLTITKESGKSAEQKGC